MECVVPVLIHHQELFSTKNLRKEDILDLPQVAKVDSFWDSACPRVLCEDRILRTAERSRRLNACWGGIDGIACV